MTAVARWCIRHRRYVLLGWLAALLICGALALRTGSAYSNNFTLPGTETQHALDLLKARFPQESGDVDTIVLHARSGTVTDRTTRQAVTTMLSRIQAIPHVRLVVSPYTPLGRNQISADGTIAFARVLFDGNSIQVPVPTVKHVISTAKSVQTQNLQVELGGQAIGRLHQTIGGASVIAGVLAAAVILFLAFGSWRGMVTPLINALAALAVGQSLIVLLSHTVSMADFSSELATLIGLGVGVDYALFIVSRHRANLIRGLSVEDSIATAVNTSGRAVLFAGATVCVALLGLLLLGVDFLNGVALGSAITVALTVATAITLLPAMLGFMGMRVLGRRTLRELSTPEGAHDHASGSWAKWALTVQRHRWPLAAVAIAVIALFAVPVFSMRLGSTDQGNDAKSTTTRQAYDLLARGFGPGFNGPLSVVVAFNGPGDPASLAPLTQALRSAQGVATVSPPVMSPTGNAAVISVVPTSAPEDAATASLVRRLRNVVVPAVARAPGEQAVYVGGITAAFVDFAHVLASKLPLFIGVVVLVAFLLLMVAFRSLLVPLTAAIMNVLAAAASFGVLVFVFQKGHLASLFPIGRAGPVDSFVPVMLFAILFGLSMDYQVFLVSRMHEEWLHTSDNSEAVRRGQAETGRIINAAALIMIVVFVSFVFGGLRQVAEFGLGMSAAVLLDAFVLRTVLVPAVMHAIGPSNWWMPRWLDRLLPHLSIEPEEPADAPVPAPEPAGL